MRLWQIIAITILGHTAFNGSRVAMSLFAIHLHATPLVVGALMSLYALLPMLFAVSAGRMVDRIGARLPILFASAALAAGTLLPFLAPRLETLYFASTLIGTGFMVFHVALNQVVGAIGSAENRATNFSWLALGFSTSGSLGPLIAGFSIDWTSHATTFLILSVFPVIPVIVLALNRPPLPEAKPPKGPQAPRSVMDLLRKRELRHVLIASGMLSMGWDLYTFVLPIYGSRIGLSASTIGTIMGTFAIATFAVRLMMPLLVRRVKEWQMITASLAISAAAYSLFPFVTSVALLMALSFLLGIGLGCAQPMVMALLYGASPPGRQGEAVGVRTTVLNASHTVLPLAFGALGAALGMGPVFWSMAVLLAAGGHFANRKRRHG
jgi:predicted MFS family arabinose efflux permease